MRGMKGQRLIHWENNLRIRTSVGVRGSKEWDLSRVMPCLLPWAQVVMHNMHACITSCEQSHLMEEHLFTQPQVPCCVPCQEKPPHCASIKSFHWHSFWNRKCVIFTIWGGGVGLQELFTSLAQAGSHPASAPIHRLDRILCVLKKKHLPCLVFIFMWQWLNQQQTLVWYSVLALPLKWTLLNQFLWWTT